MIAFDFGNLCFNASHLEDSILIVVAPKNEFSSLDDFITAALKFLESDEELYDNWTEIYKERTNLPASDDDIKWMKSRLDAMNESVYILYEPIIKAVNVIPPRWNDTPMGLETKSEYILYLWGTSA